MPVDFSRIVAGQSYDRKELATLWSYKSFHAFGRGIFTPTGQNCIVLFISGEHKPAVPQYDNRFDGELLWMDGAESHRSDSRIANSLGKDEVHLFFRDDPKLAFRYCGEVFLVESFLKEGTQPSRFLFTAKLDLVKEAETVIDSTLADEGFTPETEGRRILRVHVVYERSKKNRDRALDVHGRTCMVCGFDFDAVYGADLGGSYVEVHHCRSITEIRGQSVNPDTELVPLCANCHRMAHRRRGSIVPVQELRQRVQGFRNWPFPMPTATLKNVSVNPNAPSP